MRGLGFRVYGLEVSFSGFRGIWCVLEAVYGGSRRVWDFGTWGLRQQSKSLNPKPPSSLKPFMSKGVAEGSGSGSRWDLPFATPQSFLLEPTAAKGFTP